MNITIKNDHSKLNASISEYDGHPLGLKDQFPLGHLAGALVENAILHDPHFVYMMVHQKKIILKGDAIMYLFKFVDANGAKIVARGKKGF